MNEPLEIGILGPGRIAAAFVEGNEPSVRINVAAVGSRSEERANAFAERFGISHSYPTYQDLVNSPEIKAVYIATPNSEHKAWVLKSLAAGKHVLCEKPIALSEVDALELFEVAEAAGLVLLEAFPFRFQPQTISIMEQISQGALGELVSFNAGFGFSMSRENDVRLKPELGGGSFWDVGCYCVNLARAVYGKAPSRVFGKAKSSDSGVDKSASVLLEYDDGRSGTVWSSFESTNFRFAAIVGSKGAIEYDFPNHTSSKAEASYEIKGRVFTSPYGSGFQYEAEGFADVIEGKPNRGTTPQESIENAATCEAIYESFRLGGPVGVRRVAAK